MQNERKKEHGKKEKRNGPKKYISGCRLIKIFKKKMQMGKQALQFKKLKWQLRNLANNGPSKRWGHTAVVHNKHLLIYGGSHTGQVIQPIFRFHCDSLECDHVNFQNAPEIRESHSCNLINDSLYVFGGCINQVHTSDLLEFKMTENNTYWRKIDQVNPIRPRESHVSLTLQQRYILIYGGYSPEETTYDDFWLFDTQKFTWIPINNIQGVLEPRIGSSITSVNKEIYMFGGQFGEGEDSQYSNQLYKITFSHENFNIPENVPTMSIEKVKISGIKPSPRTGHCSLEYKNRYLIVIGGQGVSVKRAPILYNDVWVYDTKSNYWFEVPIQNRNLFRPRSNFTASINKNVIIVFGGFITLGTFRCTDEMLTLTLNQPKEAQEKKITSVCTLCKFEYSVTNKNNLDNKTDTKVPADNHLTSSLHTVLKVSQSISNPLEAIGLLISSYSILQNEIKKQFYVSLFQLEPTTDALVAQDQYLCFNFNNLKLTKKELQKIIYSFQYTPICFSSCPPSLKEQLRPILLNYLGYNTKTTLLRLGTQLLLCYLFEDDIMHCYHLSMRGIFKFTLHIRSTSHEHSETGEYKIIIEFITYYKIKIELIEKGKLYIFVGSMYKTEDNHYQITVNSDAEISVVLSDKNQNYTLSKFIKHYWLTNESLPHLFINNKKAQIIPFEKISTISEDQSFKFIKRLKLQMIKEEGGQTMGIRIYHNNRYIGKFNKYPKIVGFIQLESNTELNISFTRFQNTSYLKKILDQATKQLIETSRKRSPEISVAQLENSVQ